MEAEKISVLLISRSQRLHSPFWSSLDGRGCASWLATSSQEFGELLGNHSFDLVLSPLRLNGDSMYHLMGRLNGSRTTLFYSQPVEDGCWWLPAFWRGSHCFGAPAIRVGEFVPVLDAIIEEIRSSMHVAAKARQTVVPSLPGSHETLPHSPREPRAALRAIAMSLNFAARESLG